MNLFLENIINLKSPIHIGDKAFQRIMTYVIFNNEANHILNKQIKTHLFQES
jgi:hypothetical protein